MCSCCRLNRRRLQSDTEIHRSLNTNKASVHSSISLFFPRSHEFCSVKSMKETLTDAQRDEFENMLRDLADSYYSKKEAMGFVLDNADAAGEIVDILTQSLTIEGIPIAKKVARLGLVSDILQESGAHGRNPYAYRTKFEATLPDIIESFSDVYHSLMEIRSAAAVSLKGRVLEILQVWFNCFVFSDPYLNGLKATFLRSKNFGVNRFDYMHGDATNELMSPPIAGLTTVPLAELERHYCARNGMSVVQGREMVGHLYGDEALPPLPPQGIKSATSRTFPIPQPEQHRSIKNPRLSYSLSGSGSGSGNVLYMQKLRRLEVSLMVKKEIEKKVVAYRKLLQTEYGLSDSDEDVQRNRMTYSERRDRYDVSRKHHHSSSTSQ